MCTRHRRLSLVNPFGPSGVLIHCCLGHFVQHGVYYHGSQERQSSAGVGKTLMLGHEEQIKVHLSIPEPLFPGRAQALRAKRLSLRQISI